VDEVNIMNTIFEKIHRHAFTCTVVYASVSASLAPYVI